MQDLATNNKVNAESEPTRITSGRVKLVNNTQPLTPIKDGPTESTTLNKFRETIKDVLEEITVLEVNTIIVSNIPIIRFDARQFYADLIESIMYKTEEGLQDIRRSLLDRSKDLQKQGSAVSQIELDRYNHDLEIYKRAERSFNNRQNSTDPRQKEQFEIEQACYEELAEKVLPLNIPKDAEGRIITDAPMICYFRKLWELEQSLLNGERIYVQTKFHLDGDLTNRFLDDLFAPARSKIDPNMARLVFDLHNQAVENSQKQWTDLITTCVNLVKDLMQFRPK